MRGSHGRAVIVGANGQLGRALQDRLPNATPAARPDIDITDRRSVDSFDWSGVDVVYNLAAYTAVDKAETERAVAWATNAAGPAHLARAASRHGFLLVHTSTEYVFDGTAIGPVGEDTPVAPLGVYGASKAAGEFAVASTPRYLIVRTTWLVGDGQNFVRTMLSLARRGSAPAVVGDQIGRPTFAVDLARAMTELVAEVDDPSGTYNVTNGGDPVSWAGIARLVFEHAGRPAADVREVSTADYMADKPAGATRPANSVLDLSRLNQVGVITPHWQQSLATYLDGAS